MKQERNKTAASQSKRRKGKEAMMKHCSSFLLLLLLLLALLLLGAGTNTTSATSDSHSWSLELANTPGDQATLNKVWCASPTGDLAFGPVQGADSSAPDASIWAVTQSTDQFLVQLRLPATLDYSCRLETPPSLWSFSLPLSTLNQDGYASGDIKCQGPWHWRGVNPEDIPPGCQLFSADDYAIASVVVTSLTVDQSNATAPAPSPSAPFSNAPAHGPVPSFDSSSSKVNPASSSSMPISGSTEDSSEQPVASPTSVSPSPTSTPTTATTPVASPTSMSPSPTPTTAPRPGRKLLHGS